MCLRTHNPKALGFRTAPRHPKTIRQHCPARRMRTSAQAGETILRFGFPTWSPVLRARAHSARPKEGTKVGTFVDKCLCSAPISGPVLPQRPVMKHHLNQLRVLLGRKGLVPQHCALGLRKTHLGLEADDDLVARQDARRVAVIALHPPTWQGAAELVRTLGDVLWESFNAGGNVPLLGKVLGPSTAESVTLRSRHLKSSHFSHPLGKRKKSAITALVSLGL